MKTLSDALVVIAAIGSLVMSALGFSIAVWRGFWSSHGYLDLLLWLIPSLSVFAFLTYFVSKRAGLVCAWAIAIGYAVTAACYFAFRGAAPVILLFSLVQAIVCAALHGDSRIQDKLRKAQLTRTLQG
jgi:hypothetical protein